MKIKKILATIAIVALLCLSSVLVFNVAATGDDAAATTATKEFTVVVGTGDDAEEKIYDFSGENEEAKTPKDYVEDYANNLTYDADFKEHQTEAIGLVREDINLYATFWSLVPPVIAILLALITKEVYSSLFIGILAGGLIYSGFNLETTMVHVFSDGFVSSVADSYNVGILIFLVLLGALVAMMNKAGGSAAFGKWAAKHIKTRVGAQLATVALGVLIFIDDYFNCLTVGSVMRPVTDKNNISRAKLAYLIDATAAPVCIIAPISSWAAAVAGFAQGSGAKSGISLFISAIPYNFYALLTILMMIAIAIFKIDYGPMKKHETNAENGDIFTSKIQKTVEEMSQNEKGRVCDLVVPVVFLIIACVFGMIYSGGFFDSESGQYLNFVSAFSQSDASVGLVYGSFIALIFAVIFYLCRRVFSFKECMECIPEGFKAMVPAIMILVCAWTLKAMTDSLGAKIFISQIVESGAGALMSFLPAIIFLIAVGLSFATGTSWGTFGILIPIVLSVFGAEDGNITIVAISACMAGAVCGDHCSPISDTTIMASAGAQCDHINHVSTQLPYAITVAAITFVCYIISGFVSNWIIVLPIGIVLTIATLFVIKKISCKKA